MTCLKTQRKQVQTLQLTCLNHFLVTHEPIKQTTDKSITTKQTSAKSTNETVTLEKERKVLNASLSSNETEHSTLANDQHPATHVVPSKNETATGKTFLHISYLFRTDSREEYLNVVIGGSTFIVLIALIITVWIVLYL